MKPIISVEGLGKSYVIRHEGQTRYKSLREEIFQLPKRLLHRGTQSQEEFWALKDVSFDVMPGDRVGIIGRNGAGKSTLLKLLSRITEPTTGRITLRGRVASLLEVGTGFHPELTGRENIFLNGAILGMSRAEVRRKFDEIVDFAGVEKFLDTPVKRYSSGMYVRLAFAVAAHLEPEILIVDEVLAVGDAEFQKKCLGKMEAVGKEGRTVLFVSHNLQAIQQLCDRAIYIKKSTIEKAGVTNDVVYFYTGDSSHQGCEIKLLNDTAGLELLDCMLVGPTGNELQEIKMQTDTLTFIFKINIIKKQTAIKLGLAINSAIGQRITTIHIEDGEKNFEACDLQLGIQKIQCQVPNLSLTPGIYNYTFGIRNAKDESIAVSTSPGKFFSVYTHHKFNNISGMVAQKSKWTIK